MKVSFRQRAYSIFFRFSPLLIVVLLELGLRLWGIGDSYLLFSTSSDKQYYELNHLYYRRFVAAEQFNDIPILPQRFPVKKSNNTRRIFLIGDQSLCSYFPDANTKQILPDFYDSDSLYYDIIQIAVPYTNSFAMVRLVKCLNRYDADGYVVVSGANEFYGIPRKSKWMEDIDNYWGLTAYVTLKNHRFLQILERFVYLKKDSHTEFPPADIDEWAVPYQSDLYLEAESYFERNLKRMIKKAEKPLFLVSLPENIKIRPYRSFFDDKELQDADIAQECAVLVDNADRFTIDRWINDLKAWEPQTAIYYHCLAKINEHEGQTEEALKNYARALDLDVFRVRSNAHFNDLIDMYSGMYGKGLIDVRGSMLNATSKGLYIDRYFSNGLAFNNRGKKQFTDKIKESLTHYFQSPK
ncbi:MAG: hypothetical protein KAT14_07690 [Candidatus Marinimicrobia bacterium]|nr:hypothetical protein [Candidatus Neomarinimicrobiota bacterium]